MNQSAATRGADNLQLFSPLIDWQVDWLLFSTLIFGYTALRRRSAYDQKSVRFKR